MAMLDTSAVHHGKILILLRWSRHVSLVLWNDTVGAHRVNDAVRCLNRGVKMTGLILRSALLWSSVTIG